MLLRKNTEITKSKSKLLQNNSTVHKSKSKEKGIGQGQTKRQILNKLKKDMLPVSSMKIKLM